MKKTTILKTLLVAVGLSTGVSAWGGTETYNITSWMSGLDGSYMVEYESDATFQVNGSNMYLFKDLTQENYTGLNHTGYFELTLNGRFACSGHNSDKNQGMYFNRSSSSGYYLVPRNKARYFSLCGLYNGESFTITTNGDNRMYFYSSNATYLVNDVATQVTGGGSTGTAVVSGTTYTVSTAEGSDTHVDFYLVAWGGFGSITITTEDVTAPTATLSSVNSSTGVRTIDVTGGTSSFSKTVTTYYSTTTELTSSNYATSGTKLESSSVEVAADVTNLYLISVSASGKCSDSYTYDVAAATTLGEPTITFSNDLAATGNYYFPIVTVAANESDASLVGAPTATLTATLNGDAISITDNTITTTAAGTLIVTASANGYVSNSAEYTVNQYYKKLSYDFSTLDISDNDQWSWGKDDWAFDGWSDTYKGSRYAPKKGATSKSVFTGVDMGTNSLHFVTGIGVGYAVAGSSNGTYISLSDAVSTDINKLCVYTYSESTQTATTNVETTTGTNTFRLLKYKYSSYRALKSIDAYTIYSSSVSGTIGETGYSTFSSIYPLDLNNITGDITVYYASSVANGVVKLKAATGTVPAGEGLILAGNPSTAYTIPVTTTGTAISGNLLVGCPLTTTLTYATSSKANDYVLVSNDGTAEFQNIADYVNTNTGTTESPAYGNTVAIGGGKAFLNVTTGAGARLSVFFDNEETTGINQINNGKLSTDNSFYNMQGQRVDNPTKGLYIVNGKKVIIK